MRILVVLLFILPLAAAGTAEDPEVTDASGDSVSTNSNLSATGADLLKGWFNEDGDNILFMFESASMCADSTETIEYRWFATVDGAEVAFGADLFGMGGFCFSGTGDTTITPTGAATSASFAGNIATLTVPKTAFGDGSDGTILAAPYGTSKAYVTSPEAWNDSDRAPDAAGGREYVIGGMPEVTARVEYVNTTERVDQVTNAGDPLDATYLFNYTGPENVTLAVQVQGNGTVNVTVIDPTGNQQFACACTNGTNETHAFTSSAGVWQVNITYTAFQGNATISLAPTPVGEQMDDPGEMPEPDDDVEGNVTDDPEPGKDSPAPLIVAVGALLVAARRRR